MKKPNRFDLLRGEQGASLVEMAILLPLFVLLLFGAVDFGRAFYLVIEIGGAAHAGAIYGSQNPNDAAGMKTAAQDDAADVPNLSVSTPTYGCECPNGNDYGSTCPALATCTTGPPVWLVKVTVTATYTPLFPWPGIPSSMSFSSSASMRSAGS